MISKAITGGRLSCETKNPGPGPAIVSWGETHKAGLDLINGRLCRIGERDQLSRRVIGLGQGGLGLRIHDSEKLSALDSPYQQPIAFYRNHAVTLVEEASLSVLHTNFDALNFSRDALHEKLVGPY